MDGLSSYPVSNRISELPMEGANSPNILLLIANNGHHGSADPHDDHDRPSGECNNNLYESRIRSYLVSEPDMPETDLGHAISKPNCPDRNLINEI
ncbi:hypothetical protein PCANC_08393 [Puccinia coronata f. sp. avenae]|uniref:Uncharacterized protein n=1 Tax=Puccinia coronata f. sp. avenae TaxID=200324 RepID=A0A2N5V6K4_9BASI|nr:hypothetical protein PCANC_25716 [Puccinia coronata f. sp. avenae]PLW45639.1 hypothetical protein PCANC_08393 [Puccinia coronata f. sp. avenae]